MRAVICDYDNDKDQRASKGGFIMFTFLNIQQSCPKILKNLDILWILVENRANEVSAFENSS